MLMTEDNLHRYGLSSNPAIINPEAEGNGSEEMLNEVLEEYHIWLQGIIGSWLVVAATAWATSVAGPLFVSSFLPLALVFVALVGSLVLNEKMHLRRIPALLILVGLYLVLWGKAKEMYVAPSCSKTTEARMLEFASPADRNRTSSSGDRGAEISPSTVEDV